MKKYISLAAFLMVISCLEAQAMDGVDALDVDGGSGGDAVAVSARDLLSKDLEYVKSFFNAAVVNSQTNHNAGEVLNPDPAFISPENQIAPGSFVWRVYVFPTAENVPTIGERLEPYLAQNKLNFQMMANANDANRGPFLTIFAKTPQEASRYIHGINGLLRGMHESNFLHGQAVGYGVSGYGIPDNMLPVSSGNLIRNSVSHIILDSLYIPMTGAQQVDLTHQDYLHRLHSLMTSRKFFGATYTISLGDRTGGIDFWPLWFYDDVEGQEPELFLTQQIMAAVKGMIYNFGINDKKIGDQVLRAFLPASMFAQDIPLDDWMHSLVCAAIASAAGNEFTRDTGWGSSNPKPEESFKKFIEYINNYKITILQGNVKKPETSFRALFEVATGQNLETLIPVIQSYFLNTYWGPMHAAYKENQQKKDLADKVLGSAPTKLARQGSGGGGFASVVGQLTPR